MSNNHYAISLQNHYESYFGQKGAKKLWDIDPHNKLHADFYVLEFAPNKKHIWWTYCSVGMSLGRDDDNLIEVFVFSPKKDKALVELLSIVASYHSNNDPFNIHHTFNIGQPWLDNSICDYGFISLPYLDGEALELFKYNGKIFHCYWVIPITEKEKDFKIKNGCDALEDLFEEKGIEYANPTRQSLM